jgi:hypothetical protein
MLVAIVTTLPTESGSQVFIALTISTGMLLTFANFNPYLYRYENNLAQSAQLLISFALTIGLLTLTNNGEENNDKAYGTVLLIATLLVFLAAFSLLLYEFRLLLHIFYPEKLSRFELETKRSISRMASSGSFGSFVAKDEKNEVEMHTVASSTCLSKSKSLPTHANEEDLTCKEDLSCKSMNCQLCCLRTPFLWCLYPFTYLNLTN